MASSVSYHSIKAWHWLPLLSKANSQALSCWRIAFKVRQKSYCSHMTPHSSSSKSQVHQVALSTVKLMGEWPLVVKLEVMRFHLYLLIIFFVYINQKVEGSAYLLWHYEEYISYELCFFPAFPPFGILFVKFQLCFLHSVCSCVIRQLKRFKMLLELSKTNIQFKRIYFM